MLIQLIITVLSTDLYQYSPHSSTKAKLFIDLNQVEISYIYEKLWVTNGPSTELTSRLPLLTNGKRAKMIDASGIAHVHNVAASAVASIVLWRFMGAWES